jgi:hypothetical protein
MLRLAWVFVLAVGISAHAQTPGSRGRESSANADANRPSSPSPVTEEPGPSQPDQTASATNRSLIDRLFKTLSQEEDSDGAIDTDRPTFTPAHTVVPLGRLQFESGFTFNHEQSATTRSALYDFPELALRFGLMKRLEFRTFWLGQTYIQSQSRFGGPFQRGGGGISDMEVGFKWQIIERDPKKKWRPTTALITSVYAPTGGTSPLSSQTVDPYINLIYGWKPTDKLTLCGSTGYLGMRQQAAPGSHGGADNFERFHQSLAVFFSATKRTTLFYEWYVLMFTNAADNRPTHFMDGGLLYGLTPNMQLDLRAGFGLSGRPDDFFTGVGFSVRL